MDDPGLIDDPGLRDARKRRAAALSIASNATLISLKVIAGIATGSVAILTEAVHSGTDLIASITAFVSVRKAGEPADADHLYGHEKIENLAGAIEGTLILFGAAIITYEALVRLAKGGHHVHRIGAGIVVIGVSMVANVVVSRIVGRSARQTASAALEADAAHLSADAVSSAAVLIGLALVAATGAQWLDPAIALAVAAWIALAGTRVLLRASRTLVDEALPEVELEEIRSTIRELGADRGVVGFHKLRARRAGARRYVDVHLQFGAGTTLESAHEIAHELTRAIGAQLPGSDVLVHVEPEDRLEPGTELRRD